MGPAIQFLSSSKKDIRIISLSIDVKSTADPTEFQNTLKRELLSKYSSDFICEDTKCYSCTQ